MDKIKLGDTYTEKVRFTQDEVNKFAEVTKDKNPIHIDAEYAAKTPFKKPIVHGFFAGAVFSKVFGTGWPGEGTIYMYQEMKFLAPIFVDNDYLAKFEVSELNEETHRAVISCILEDTTGKAMIVGSAKLMNVTRF